MAGAVFYIEYTSGRITQIQFRTPAAARRAYKLYSREAEDDARSYGWEVVNDAPTLTQQIREKKIQAQIAC